MKRAALVAYDDDGNVIATLDKLVVRDADGKPALVDFAAHEADGGAHLDIWHVSDAKGSKVEHVDEPDRKTARDGPRRPATLPLVGRRR